MKSLFLIFTLFFSAQSFGQTSADQSQMIKDDKCIPHRDSTTGNITKYICDKNEVNKMQNGNFERIGVQKMEIKKGDVVKNIDGAPVDSTAKAMELYNTMKATGATTLVVDREKSLVNKIKSCLSAIYSNQVKHHRIKNTYTSSNEEFILNTGALCNEIDVTAEIANQSEFRVIARSGNESWSVDQRKELTQLR